VRKKFLIGGVILLIAVAFLSYMGFMNSATYYYTVDEILQQGDAVYGENVKIGGQIMSGSVSQESASRTLRFSITDEQQSLPVIYRGAIPDTFKVGNEIVAEGQLASDGTFQAHSLIMKCPSRYTPQ
jgi:cytochrome c-type biogenesis protein CcmE